jgi:magnesium-transporting ATPase (P-type)
MNRHPLDLFSLGAGIAFLALAATFVIGQWVNVGFNGALVFPILLVVLGALGISAAMRAQRANDDAVRSTADLRDIEH